ncbi:hypothetical protein PIB30_053865 [Stylosanthes scabra]|uniref:Aminotransferase-like plant mobile domain-containing protein n=1 Tax=Stylosanthes scabra TaxID=79078 RepID=A0ABU6QKH0_9FABA|nr:hypothetical protein [Stylosanthes scabra]
MNDAHASVSQDFDRCRRYSWGSAVLAWTCRSLSSASRSGTTDLRGCVPLIMSWIYHRFPTWGPAHLDVPMFPLARRLSGLPQGARDLQAGRLLAWRYRLDRCRVEDFRWTLYGSDDLRFLSPDWIGQDLRFRLGG